MYGKVNRRLGLLLAEYKQNNRDKRVLVEEFREIRQEYLQANETNKACIPSDKDFDKARAAIEKKHQKVERLGSGSNKPKV